MLTKAHRMPNSTTSRWRRITLVAVTVVLSALGCSDGSSKPMTAEQSAAYEALKGMGAVIVKSGEHPATVMMLSPDIASDLDAAMAHLGKLPYITHLELTNQPFTDAHMAVVSDLRKINSLVLSGTQVGDEGLKTVSSLKLDTLYVDKSRMTGASMETLGGISGLTILDISGLDVSDISPLSKLENLEWLIIDNTQIGSEAMDVIASLPAIGRLSINGSTVAAEDIRKLKSAKPSLMIDQAQQAQPEETPASEESASAQN